MFFTFLRLVNVSSVPILAQGHNLVAPVVKPTSIMAPKRFARRSAHKGRKAARKDKKRRSKRKARKGKKATKQKSRRRRKKKAASASQ